MPISEEARSIQQDLLAVFEKYGLSVAVGLTQTGVAIRSQDERVDALNITIKPLSEDGVVRGD